MQGLVLKGAGNAQTAHLAFDQAAERVDKQLRRYMRRLKDRHGRALAAEAARVPGELLDGAAYTIFESGNEEEEAPEKHLIVAETRVDIPDASVSDAVMMMDLSNTNAMLLVNSGTSSYNRVYRRTDCTNGGVDRKCDGAGKRG